MKLYGYWRSSATYRVRIALELKKLEYACEPVNLLKGEQRGSAFLDRNPQGLVPALETKDGAMITQSSAIIEYLEERYPEIALLPDEAHARARVRAISAVIACEAQPFMNLRIQNYLKNHLDLDAAGVATWLEKWVGGAMATVESLVDKDSAFCVGEEPTMADAFLIPQIFGALRFGISLEKTPRISAIYERCGAIEAFIRARPDNQPDAPKDSQ